MIQKIAFVLCLVWIIVPPVAGVFINPDFSSPVVDWSMYAKPTNESLCLGTASTTIDGETWIPWNARLSRAGRATGIPHLFRTPLFFAAEEVDTYTRFVCNARPERQIRWNLWCTREFKQWNQVKNDEITDCRNLLGSGT